MKKLGKNYFNDIKYKYIFDYYDEPLFFITYGHEKYNMFYFIDPKTFFMVDLTKPIVDKIFSGCSTLDILKFVQNAGLLNVLRTNKGFEKYSFKGYEKIFSVNLEHFYPKEDIYIEEDFLTHKSFKTLKKEYEANFPEFYNITDVSIRLKDSNDSKSVPADYVSESINFMEALFKNFKRIFEGKGNFSNSRLDISSLSPGSVRINFKIGKNPEVLNSSNVQFDFGDLINFINDLYVEKTEKIYESDISRNESIIEATQKYFSFLIKNKINVDFDSQRTRVASISLNNKNIISSKIKGINTLSKIDKTNQINEDFEYRGEILSTSIRKNSFSFKILNNKTGQETISGEFSDKLFQALKNKTKQIIIPMDTKIKGQKIYNKITDKEKYIITEYEQRK